VDLDLVARERADQDNEEFYISSLLAGLPLIKVDDLLNPKSGFQILPTSNGQAAFWVLRWIL